MTLTLEQKGSAVFAIELLAKALAHEDPAAAELARTQLEVMFPPTEKRRNEPGAGHVQA